jgi:hypothetical protein
VPGFPLQIQVYLNGHEWLAKVSRSFRRFHAHRLIAEIPRTRRWRVPSMGAK